MGQIITFLMSRRRREMYCGHGDCVCVCVFQSVLEVASGTAVEETAYQPVRA